MKDIDHLARANGTSFLSRDEVLTAGGTDRMISFRLKSGLWANPHPGVYRLGPDPTGWLEQLDAAVTAAGPSALVSHRSAYVLWGLDGITSQMLEITVPYDHAPIPNGVLRHRTRREMAREIVQGLPVTSVTRTLLDAARYLPLPVVIKGVDSALRRELTTLPGLWDTAEREGGRGVPGAGMYRTAVAHIEDHGSTGSPAEAELLIEMKRAGIPAPVPQYEIVTPSGRRYLVDFGWPDLDKGVEVDGLDAHSGAQNLERDLIRQNDLLAAGLELRRFTARQVRRQPQVVVEDIRRFLQGKP